MKKQMGLIAVLVLIATLVFGGTAQVGAAGTTIVVSPTNMHGWVFVNDQTNGPGTGTLVDGPGHPPLGTGSANLSVTGPTDGQILAAVTNAGTRLDAITTLRYSTYISSPQSPPSITDISLQFGIDYDVTDTNTSYQGRLVFEPYYTGTPVQSGMWQTWNPLAGKWWATKAPGNTVCKQASPCTWAQVLTNWPNAGINANNGATVFKAGSGWAAFNGNVDAFTIGVHGANTTYDFEKHTVPTDKEQCKNGGWKTFNPPTGPFKNQGACVSYVEHHRTGDKDHHDDGGDGHHGNGGDDNSNGSNGHPKGND